MASIGSVVTKITANTEGMTAGVTKAQAILKGGMAKMAESVKGFGEVFAGVVAGNFATDAIKKGLSTFVGMFTAGNEAILSMGKAARKAGVDIGGMQVVAEAMGGDLEKAAEGMLKLNENLGKAIVEGQEEPFKKLGLDAMALSAMTADKRMVTLAEKLTAIQDPIARARAGTAIFSDQWKELSGILGDGGKLLNQTAESLDKFGAGFNESALQAAKDAEQAFKQVGYLWKGLYNQIGQAIAPIVAEADKLFGKIADYGVTFKGLRDKIIDAFEWIAKSGQTAWSTIFDTKKLQTFWIGIQKMVTGLGELFASVFSNALASAFDSINLSIFKNAAKNLRQKSKDQSASSQLSFSAGFAFFSQLKEGVDFTKIDKFFNEVRNRIQDTKKDAQQFNPFELWAQSMDKLKEGMKTGFDTFREEAVRVVKLMDFARKAGRLTAEDAAVGFQALGRNVQQLLANVGQVKFAGAMEAGSSEAYSAILAARFEGKRSVQEMIADLARQQLEEQRTQTELGKQTVAALENLGFVERAIP
jgi:hypothetical protein